MKQPSLYVVLGGTLLVVNVLVLSYPSYGQDEPRTQGAEMTTDTTPNPSAEGKTSLSRLIQELKAQENEYYARASAAMPYRFDDAGNAVPVEPEPDTMRTQWQIIPPLDAALRRCLLAAFQELGTVEGVRRALEGVVVLREVALGTFDMRDSVNAPLAGVDMPITPNLSEEAKLPEVLCFPVETSQGAKIYGMQHSLLRPIRGWARGLTVPYIITVLPGDAFVSELPDLGDNFAISFASTYAPSFFLYFLDAYHTKADHPSVVVVAYGVAGAVDLGLYRYDLDPVARIWNQADYIAPPGIYKTAEIYYSSDDAKLRYRYSNERFEQSYNAAFDVGEWVGGSSVRE